jgi:hypothetical protein
LDCGPPNKALQLTAARFGCCAGSRGRRPPNSWLTRGGRRSTLGSNTGRPQLSADPLGGEIYILRRLLSVQVFWSGLLTVVALNVTFRPGPLSVALPLFFVLYFISSVGAKYRIRPFFVCALAQLVIMWLGSLASLLMQVRAALFLDSHRDARTASIAIGIYLILTVIPPTLLVWGFWRQRPQVVATLQRRTLAA